MRLWTLLSGLAVAGVVASSLYAQDAPKHGGKSNKHGGFQAPSYADMMKGQPDGALLTQKIYVNARTKNLPADMSQDRKDSIAKRAAETYKAIAKAAKVEIKSDSDGLTADQYKAGLEAVQKTFRGRGGHGGHGGWGGHGGSGGHGGGGGDSGGSGSSSSSGSRST